MEYALVVRWLVLFAALWAVGLPLSTRLFRRLPGHGAGLTLPVSLVVLTLPVYYVGQFTFGPAALAAGVGTFLVASALTGLDLPALRHGEVQLAADLDIDRRAVAEAAAVFLVAFLFAVALRALDPAVHASGGEKFLDFGLLQSLARASVLPPEDMWFAGEPVRYYYGGHLVSILLAWLTGTEPEFAYNLALAGFFGFLVTAAFELGRGLSRAAGSHGKFGGLLAAFFVGFASNLVTAVRFAPLALPDSMQRPIAQAIAERSQYSVSEVLSGASQFSYWDASRVVPGTINEFPLFAWLNGDLHAHMMGTPFLLLAAGLTFAYFRTPEDAVGERRLLVGVTTLVGALQVVVDTWSFPSVFGVLFLGLVFAPARPSTLLLSRDRLRALVGDNAVASEVARILGTVLVVGLAGGAAVALASPFLLGAVAGGGSERTIEILTPTQRSGFGSLLLVHGAFITAFVLHYARRLGSQQENDPSRAQILAVLGGLVTLTVVAAVHSFAALALVVPLVLVGWILLRLSDDPRFETVLVVAGAGLVTLVELIFVNEQAGPGRMNTVFKTYMQVWVLWGSATGAILARFAGDAVQASDLSLPKVDFRIPAGAIRVVGVVVVVLLVASTSVYGGLAIGKHTNSPRQDTTLDATAFAEWRHPNESAAITWLDESVDGNPTMLAAPGTTWSATVNDKREGVMYGWRGNPESSLTGVPTVAGWAHEVGYRGPEAYYDRVRDVDQMYVGNESTQKELIAEYDVQYVWVGPGERARYGEIHTDVAWLTPVHRSGSVVVYEVEEARLR
ncbi:hypothetical protein E6P09_06355 [Haloferax mediterranei ATCC 33500]|uniref:Chlor_Arch_YYY domain-containing protein n=1 Tax=Haloferax mediterranei (strain ATCC 33500 / DSM 1411 / JCM 8866 / NBRC 14739 / NCIMB 2177 / R-4) TaxID=523841 RepID=I3R2C6_HALMT|nr:DUF2298 domain-containing protein [Haloferax mediterranei]AFK18386.1 hypothetical protein HFX_0662 [Haloferax mediterranei ATCC 33500]AHZ22220.1 hypothetical protein BM92_05930 [Haloferax mediterranei ATCC 33500]EMA02339.1 hypothetical protein C439_07150 [Haloferax mediterranei ATCC 33500]MDX5988478.1 DUF2298 domain-containing protein [Haloferax mediterranei ATCC 33500]QCQ74896.1 hypothetical protein E6P09_06355 [Haloferax mediterranei ATCC 33500]